MSVEKFLKIGQQMSAKVPHTHGFGIFFPLQFYRYYILISVCLKIVKKISYYILIYNKIFFCFYTVVEGKNETTVKL